MTSKAALLSYLRSLSDVARFEEDSISLSTLPLFHIGGTGWALAGLYRGASVLLLPNADPDLILETVSARGVTNLIAVPSMVQMLLDSPRLSVTDFSALRYLYYGGGADAGACFAPSHRYLRLRFHPGIRDDGMSPDLRTRTRISRNRTSRC